MQKNQGGDDSDEELPKGSNSIGLEEDELDEDVESSGEEFVAGNTEDCCSGLLFFFCYKTKLCLDPSYKADIGLWDCVGRVKHVL